MMTPSALLLGLELPAWKVVVAAFLLLVVGFSLLAIFVWWQRRQYTRERFAFALVGTFTSAFTVVVAALVGDHGVVGLVVELANELFGLSLPPPASNHQGELFVVAYALLVVPLYFIYRDWGGARSLEAVQRDRSTPPTVVVMLKEAVSETRYLGGRRRELAPDESDNEPLEIERRKLGTRAWHERARRLLELTSQSYDFESEASGWNNLDKVYRGWIRGRNRHLFMLCVGDEPGAHELEALVAYAEERGKEEGFESVRFELCVVIEGEGTRLEDRHVGGNKIWLKYENTLLDELVDFGSYRRAIVKRVTKDQLEDSDLTLSDIYVESKIGEGESLLEHVKAWLAKGAEKRQRVLFGDYGRGKTTAAYMLCFQLLQEGHRRIPIVIELRGRSPRNLASGDLLALWGKKYGIHGEALMELHRAGRLLLIFEGVDEMDLVGDRQVRRANMRALWAYDYEDVSTKILITGRPNFGFGDREAKEDFGVGAYCEGLTLAPFTISDIEVALRNSSHRHEIVDQANKNELLRELISRPSMLHVVSVIWEKLKMQGRVNSAAAMQLYVERTYVRESKRRKREREDKMAQSVEVDNFALTLSERDYFMRGIASYMTLNGLQNYITREQFGEVLAKLLASIPDSLSTDVAGGEPDTPLRRRLPDGERRMSTLARTVQTRG